MRFAWECRDSDEKQNKSFGPRRWKRCVHCGEKFLGIKEADLCYPCEAQAIKEETRYP